jgi:beta-lactamase regulating signal transducer with metallopeptidase domain
MTTQYPPSGLHWSFWVLLLWFTGMLISSFRIIIGKISFFHCRKKDHFHELKQCGHLLNQLSKKMRTHKETVLLKSKKCKVPFASNIFSPIIVLPTEIENWPSEKIRAVLTHELAHIHRRDYLTQFIARMVGSIFWFMPLTWVAYLNLHLEQEKATDSTVVYTGVKPTDYASQLREFAYSQRKRFLHVGLFITKGKKMVLEKRILNKDKRISL